MQTGDDKKLLVNELNRLFRTLRPFTELPESIVLSFAEALEDLTGPEIAVMVQVALRERWEYLPTPGDLLAIVHKFREELPAPEEIPNVCSLCQGTKFRRVLLPGETRCLAAVPCACMGNEPRSKWKGWISKFSRQYVSTVSKPHFADDPRQTLGHFREDSPEKKEFFSLLSSMKTKPETDFGRRKVLQAQKMAMDSEP